MKLKVIVASLAMVMAVGVASAQNQKAETTQAKKSCFVDENKNSVCDKYEDGSCKRGNGKGLQDGSGRVDGKGQGMKDGSGRKSGQGHHGGKGRNQGKGLKDGSGRDNGGRGARFVDADKNGVCDNREKK